MKNLVFILLLFLTTFLESTAQTKFSGPFRLTIDVSRVSPQPARLFLQYLSTTPNGLKSVLDSADVKNNIVTFSGNLTEPTAGLVTPVSFRGKERAKSSEMLRVYLEPVPMQVIVHDSLASNVVSGTKYTTDYQAVASKNRVMQAKIKDVAIAYRKALHNKEDSLLVKKLLNETVALNADLNSFLKEATIRLAKTSPVALYALDLYAPVLLRSSPKSADSLFTLLADSFQKLPSGVALQTKIQAATKTVVGQMAPDFMQPDTSGNPVTLTSYRGKYVLVDFWASWCGPCRAESPNLLKAYDKYRSRNFTVLGVSVDRAEARAKWLAAIHKDGLTWTQVSDLKPNNAAARLYNIQTIPQNFLIDPTGKIIAINLRGENLDKQLDMLIK